MNWWNRLYAMTPANPPKSMAGCLVANILLTLALVFLLYLAGLPLAWFR